jgi:diaminopimelate decarboxylase
MKEFKQAQRVNWVKQLDLQSLLDVFDSPAWIVSEYQLKYNIDTFSRFTGANNQILFPVKANPSLTVLQLLAVLGVGADCASRAEIDLARFAGIDIQSISYNSPVQDVQLCKFLLEEGARVVMDDTEAILELQKVIGNNTFKGKLLIRLNLPDYIGYSNKSDNQELMAHGHSSSKFGIPVEDLDGFLAEVTLPVSGIHVHVGTQMDNIESFEFAINELHFWAEQIINLGFPISEINMGGGLGIPFIESDCFPSLESWVESLSRQKKEKFNYFVEPGHAIVGNAVALLMRVLTVKNSRGKKWAITDVGTDQLAKITLLRWPHRILNAKGEELHQGIDAIAGPLCFAGDTLLENISVEGLSKKSPLLLTEAGAYTYSLANGFNGRLAPKWILLKANGEILETMRSEDRYENAQYANFNWGLDTEFREQQELQIDHVLQLSSSYLRETSSLDSFSYLHVLKKSENKYEFVVSTSSEVAFISMPFAIRILGDAAIVAVLHNDGHEVKRDAVWGRRLVMDCFDKLASNQDISFYLSLSDAYESGLFKARVVRFSSSCEKCVGSFILYY